MLTCPAASPFGAAIGASENGVCSCPTHRNGSALTRSRQDSCCSRVSRAGNTERPRSVGRSTICSKCASTWDLSESLPHQWVGTDSSFSVSPRIALASCGRNGSIPGLSRMPLPSGLTTVTVPRRQASVSPTTPSREFGRRSSGSDQEASTRRTTTSTGST